jgi:alanine dehydrogenase
MALFLREEEVAALLSMPDAIDAVEEAFRRVGRGEGVNRPRQRVQMPGGTLQVMPAGVRGMGLGFKAYLSRREGIRFWFWLFDDSTGDLLAVMEADRLGQIRTGAASGVATRYLARPDARRVGIYGTGGQARTQLAAVCAVRPIEHVLAFSRNPENVASYCREMSEQLGIPVEPAADAAACARERDILITITNAREPVLLGEWLTPGTHINAAGTNRSIGREIDEQVVLRADLVVCDSVEQSRIESGDLIWPAEQGLWDWSRAVEMTAMIAGGAGRTSPAQITLFNSNGVALEDVAAASVVYRNAVARGIGRPVPF